MPRHLLLAALVALCATGCLGRTLTIPTDELRRVAETPADERAFGPQRVRVVQDTSFADEPGGPDPCAGHDHSTFALEIHAHHSHHHHGHHRAGYHSSGGSGGGGAIGGSGGGRSSGSSSGSSGAARGSLDFDIDSGKVLVIVVVAAAAIATVALIATEGMRYDGWVEVAPHHPIHLIDGRRERAVHLAELRPEHIGPNTRAVIRPDEGTGAEYQGRAPLDRQGMVWRMEMGAMQVLTPDESDPAVTAATMQLGYFPHQTFGLLGTTTLAWGEHRGNDLLAARYGLEAQFIPLALGPVHLGAYGMGGWAYNARDNGDLIAGQSNRLMVGAGALAEIEVTTRLAVSMRFGANWRNWHRAGLERPALGASLGFAIY